MALGVEALSERELLALVLRSGRVGESAVDLAGDLLARFGGLRGLGQALPEELAAIVGIGPAKAAAVVAALRLNALGRRDKDAQLLCSSADVARVASEHLRNVRRERVVVLICDASNRVILLLPVAQGSIDRCLVPIREILNAVLRHDGRSFAIAHNHPGGDPEPTDADRAATRELRDAAKTVGLRFLDHVVVAGDLWSRIPSAGG